MSAVRMLSRGASNEGASIAPAVYIIVISGVLLICVPCIYVRIAKALRDRRQRQQPLNLDEVFANAITEHFRESMRRIFDMEANTHNERPLGMTKEHRKEYLDNVLSTKKLVLGGESDIEQPSVPPTESSLSDPETFVLNVKDGDENEEACAICMEEYKNGDIVGWSHNEHCQHFFHRQCIHEWLMTHEECPCCRTPYLAFADDSESARNPRELEQSFVLAQGMELLYRLSRGLATEEELREAEQNELEMRVAPDANPAAPP